MNAYIEILRPSVCGLAILAFLAGGLVANALVWPAFFLATLVVVLETGAGNVINDYFDVEVDKRNKPHRAIPSGRMKKTDALGYFYFLIAMSLLLAYFVSPNFFLIALFNAVVLTVYSWKLKMLPFIGNAVDSYLATSIYVAAGLVLGSISSLANSAIWVLAAISFFGNLGREITKDIEDMKADKAEGGNTLPILIGKKRADMVSDTSLAIAIALLALPYHLRMLSGFYLLGAVPGALATVKAMFEMDAHKAQKRMKVAMYLILAGFILGAFFK